MLKNTSLTIASASRLLFTLLFAFNSTSLFASPRGSLTVEDTPNLTLTQDKLGNLEISDGKYTLVVQREYATLPPLKSEDALSKDLQFYLFKGGSKNYMGVPTSGYNLFNVFSDQLKFEPESPGVAPFKKLLGKWDSAATTIDDLKEPLFELVVTFYTL